MLSIKNNNNVKIALLLFFIVCALFKFQAQNFQNPDLNGAPIASFSQLPTGWESVPYTDPACLATSSSLATPDLTSISQPDASTGLIGNPYSGTTFLSGLYGEASFSTAAHQEGIMQTISGFTIGEWYKINFQQAIVKQLHSEDSSGLWLVYIDSILGGATLPTFSNLGINSTLFPWESRDIFFRATDTIHTIKFLPYDDDPNHFAPNAVRMGIDSINLSTCFQGNYLGNDTLLCAGDSINLNVTTPNATYLWQDNSTDSIFTVAQPGTYWVTVTTNTCSITDSIVISSRTLPAVSLGNDTILCEEEILLLNVAILNATYLWQDNATDSTFNVTQTGLYCANVANICGTVSDSVYVIIDTLNVSLGEDTTLCLSETLLLNVATQNATYNWQYGSTDSTFLVVQAGTYWSEVTRGICLNTDTINILYDSIPNINLGNDTILCSDEILLLSATATNSSYLWNDNSTRSTLRVSSPNLYWTEVTNICGSASDSITILYENCRAALEMPNVFSPNGDDNNALFLPIESENIENFQLTIYNRWGQQLFYSQQIKHGWDGRTTAGKEVPSGTYFWISNYSDQEGHKETLKGSVSLIR